MRDITISRVHELVPKRPASPISKVEILKILIEQSVTLKSRDKQTMLE